MWGVGLSRSFVTPPPPHTTQFKRPRQLKKTRFHCGVFSGPREVWKSPTETPWDTSGIFIYPWYEENVILVLEQIQSYMQGRI